MGGVAGYMDLTVSYSTDVCGFRGRGGGMGRLKTQGTD